jgi:hypothetical protein
MIASIGWSRIIGTANLMSNGQTLAPNSGSRWHRWEPHIHAPGTILNDQFTGADAWERYLKALETTTPTIRAIGITDYYSTDTYERVVEAKNAGRLSNCDLIFPNIEMRLAVGTVKGKWVNIHLLVSPEKPDHLVELKRFLTRLTFKAHGDTYCCIKDDLIRLGQHIDSKLTEPTAALERGSEQFKISFDELRAAYSESVWAKENILIAVAGSETDGTSGVRDSADATLRQEVEKFAHIIFASSAAQRDFWLGRRSLSEEEISNRYRGLKPCMHGSDAHEQRTVGVPDGDRYSWIKGIPAFDTLRQSCIDPVGRAFVGDEPPIYATPSQIIDAIEIKDAPWTMTPIVELNPGLVAIIGARGSGKTALADIIAHGCDGTSERLSPASFLSRAQELLHGATVTVRWLEGDPSIRNLDGTDDLSAAEYPRVRYLSQKFVEELCSATEMTDELVREVERVICEAHPVSDRDGAVDFEELRELRTMRFREARAREEHALTEISEQIGINLEKSSFVPALRKQVDEKAKLIAGYTKDRAKLITKGSETRVARLADLSAAADKVAGYLRFFSAQEQSLLLMKDEIDNVRAHTAPEELRKMSERYRASAIEREEWQAFLLDYKGDVDDAVAKNLKKAQKGARDWKGTTPKATSDLDVALIPDDADLGEQPLGLLEAEISRIGKLVSVDRDAAGKFAALSKRITEETAALAKLRERLTDCAAAKERINVLVQERNDAYVRVFNAIVAEEAVLRDLYMPLMARLAGAGETLAKLSFSVTREADVDLWATAGEELLDLRRQGQFKGHGALGQIAEAILKTEWENGDAESAGAAMASFRADNQDSLLQHSPMPRSDQADYREWAKQFAKWLYGTDHIKIEYGVLYDGVDIRKLSPGTRGIVLLLLYLALDDVDDRPLVIDQPEENLDPKSIFDELVGLFLEAKKRRQVIMVTHNANLVVNTDADQIIVAQAGPRVPGRLPPISYLSGGLESADIRAAVCDTLEGGERAFQARARRLRVTLDR